MSDVTFEFNTVRDVASGINILGRDYMAPSKLTERIRIRQNVFEGLDATRWGGDGRFLLIGDAPSDIVVDHNTVIQTGSILHCHGELNGRPWRVHDLQFTNNIALHNDYGIVGDGVRLGPGDALRLYRWCERRLGECHRRWERSALSTAELLPDSGRVDVGVRRRGAPVTTFSARTAGFAVLPPTTPR